jgi:hypothetical protein
MRHAVRGIQKHPDDELVVGRNALGADTDGEHADAERKITEANMGQRAAQLAATQLHHVDMGALDRVVKAFETVQAALVDRQLLPHGSPILFVGRPSIG